MRASTLWVACPCAAAACLIYILATHVDVGGSRQLQELHTSAA